MELDKTGSASLVIIWQEQGEQMFNVCTAGKRCYSQALSKDRGQRQRTCLFALFGTKAFENGPSLRKACPGGWENNAENDGSTTSTQASTRNLGTQRKSTFYKRRKQKWATDGEILQRCCLVAAKIALRTSTTHCAENEIRVLRCSK